MSALSHMTQGDISALLVAAKTGDRGCESRLFEVVYNELRRMAAAQLRRERADHTLQPSALVHELYLLLIGPGEIGWDNRAHFFKTASGVMRNILVDYARAKRAAKRDGRLQRVDLEWDTMAFADRDLERVLAVDEALTRLAEWDARQAKVVELRYFSGFDVEETAEILGVSAKTVKRDWSMARAWLRTQLQSGRDAP
jgi:RNA polymerase sigma factor (TIGR02999 family)